MKRKSVKNKRALAASGIAMFCMVGTLLSISYKKKHDFYWRQDCWLSMP